MDLTTAEKLLNLLSEGMSTLEISKEYCRDHWMIKKTVENITKLRTWSKEKELASLRWM